MKRKEEGRVLKIKKEHVHLQGRKKQHVDSWRKAQHKWARKQQEFWALRCLGT